MGGDRLVVLVDPGVDGKVGGTGVIVQRAILLRIGLRFELDEGRKEGELTLLSRMSSISLGYGRLRWILVAVRVEFNGREGERT